jgi:hypothetical protein
MMSRVSKAGLGIRKIRNFHPATAKFPAQTKFPAIAE